MMRYLEGRMRAKLLLAMLVGACCPSQAAPNGWEIRGPTLPGAEVVVQVALSHAPCGSAPRDGVVEWGEDFTVACGDHGGTSGCCEYDAPCPPLVRVAQAPDVEHSSLLHEMGHVVWKHCYGWTAEPAVGPGSPPPEQEFLRWLIATGAAIREELGTGP